MTVALAPTVSTKVRLMREYAEVLIVIAVVTSGGWFAPMSYRAFGHIYLLAVIALSLRVSRWPMLVAAILSGVVWNYFFVPPRMSFSVLHLDDGLLLGTYFVVALIGGQLAVLRAASYREKLLAESERLHQTLFDSISHELKSPVAVLRSAVDQLGTEDRAKREQLVRALGAAVQRLERLIGNLLNQTRLESGMLRAQLEPCDARDLIAAARRAVGEKLDGHPVAIEIPEDLPLLLADAAMMEHVLGNILLNAAVHTPAGRTIRIRAGLMGDPPRVFITIADQGSGIPLHLRRVLFEKFQHGALPRRTGLGLGLSIVRGFARAQGGEVLAESPPEGGAAFTVLLPRAPHGRVPDE